ncbi:hypothetical protein IAU60_001117 [Kwoniella sp. DSM 27419]
MATQAVTAVTETAAQRRQSIFHSRPHIEEGDLVIIYMARDNMTAITVTRGQEFHNRFGRYAHSDFIGQKFGSKIHSPAPNSGYVHVLRPTPELWTLSLPHRTQILAEFDSHGLSNVTLQHRNVCKDGFNGATDVEGVFLDLPAPWEAIPHAKKTLRSDMITRICCFSPCLEQVLKTVSTLRSEGFSEVYTQEVLIRTHELVPPPASDSSFLGSVSSIVDRLKRHEQRKEERRAAQMRLAREKARKLKESEAEAGDGDSAHADAEAGSKRKHSTDDTANVGDDAVQIADIEGPASTEDETPRWNEPSTQLDAAVLTKPTSEMKGHTSYLTFASYYPDSIRASLAAQEAESSRAATPRIAQLVAEGSFRAGSQETEYGSDGLDEVMGTLTEEEMIALASK